MTSGLPVSSGSPLNEFVLHPRHLPRFIGSLAQDTRALFPAPHHRYPPIAGSAVDAGIHTPASAVQVAITPTTSRVIAPPTPSRVYFISTRLSASSTLNLCHYIGSVAFASHLHRISHLSLLRQSALPGWPPYALTAVPALYKQKI